MARGRGQGGGQVNGLVVFARMGSKRLPRKALRDVAGRPLLGRVLDRARRVPGVTLVVATTDRPEDNELAAFADVEGVPVYRGADADVAGRALGCARHFGFARFGRITGDSPFLDPEMFARLFAMHEERSLDVATNVFPRSFPPGLSAEVITTEAMARVVAETEAAYDREHVTPYIYDNPGRFMIGNVAAPPSLSARVKLAVDDEADRERAAWIMSRLGARAMTAHVGEIVEHALAYEARMAKA
jgi:spore coat polysaccharide biosynthesis protein SpsF